jgi:uncharacterized caspase-like protein
MFMNATGRTIALGVILVVGLFATECAAAKRVALVVGNAAYRSVPELRNSRNDADDISAQLKLVGFDVIDGRDLDRQGMQVALVRFAQRLADSEAALVYYSGHGVQINGQNYLVPVDATYANGDIMPLELVRLDDVIEALGYTTGVRLLVLDACRDNPLVNSLAQSRRSRGVAPGLARIERSQGMLIAYATQANAVAADGDGRNSPFTAALVREIPVPGLEVAALFRRVAIEVNRETKGDQTPELSVSLLKDFYFNPQESDVEAWKKLGPSATARDLESFISRFPSSVMVEAVKARLEAIETARVRERLVREFAENERRLRQQLESAEAGYRKAAAELAERRERDNRTRLTGDKASPGSAPAAALSVAGASAGAASVEPEQLERERQTKEALAKSESERLASQVAAFEADKARLSAERVALERAMTESLARAQSERERAEKRLAVETARLPVVAIDQSRAASPPARQLSSQKCREINARAQLGELSAGDRDFLQRQCR